MIRRIEENVSMRISIALVCLLCLLPLKETKDADFSDGLDGAATLPTVRG